MVDAKLILSDKCPPSNSISEVVFPRVSFHHQSRCHFRLARKNSEKLLRGEHIASQHHKITSKRYLSNKQELSFRCTVATRPRRAMATGTVRPDHGGRWRPDKTGTNGDAGVTAAAGAPPPLRFIRINPDGANIPSRSFDVVLWDEPRHNFEQWFADGSHPAGGRWVAMKPE